METQTIFLKGRLSGKALISSLFLLVPFMCMAQHPAFSERKEERVKLVYEELAFYSGLQIYDTAVLAAMYRVPRHAFVPENIKKHAYVNTALPIGFQQTISQPVIVASMTQLLELKKGTRVLEVGTGSGYQAAVLAEMQAEVYSIEIVAGLASRAKNTLNGLGYTSIHLKTGNGYLGWPEFAPYDRIIVTCAPEQVPQALVDQLRPGGKIVIPLGPENGFQQLVVLRKTRDGKLKERVQYPVRFVPMTGEEHN